MLHAITNQPPVSGVTCFSVDELKVEGSLFKMFLGLDNELSSVAWLQCHTSEVVLEERTTFPSVIFDILEYTPY